MMASTQVVETSVNTNNSPSQDYTTNPDDHSNHNIDSPGFKPLTVIFCNGQCSSVDATADQTNPLGRPAGVIHKWSKASLSLLSRPFQIVLGTFLARFGFGSTILIREHFFGQRASFDNFFGKQADF